MSRTRAFGDYLDSLGIWWPEGDGDAMRLAAESWTDMAEFLDDIGHVLKSVGRSITESYRGEAADRFHETWKRYITSKGYIATTVTDCRRLAAALEDFGGDIDLADDTLAKLIEEALEMRQSAAAAHADPAVYDEWLRECSALLAKDLDGRAQKRCEELGQIECMPDDALPPDMEAIDPDAISWADPGDPRNLSFLATTTVDFGAGPGKINASSIEIPVEEPPMEQPPVEQPPDVPEVPDELLPDEAVGAAGDDGSGGGGGAAGFGGGSGGFGGGGGFGGADFDPDSATPDSVPVADGALAAGAGAAAAALLGAGTAAAKSRPFFPMMPFGGMGAGGGDDGNEPKRRRRRPPLL